MSVTPYSDGSTLAIAVRLADLSGYLPRDLLAMFYRNRLTNLMGNGNRNLNFINLYFLKIFLLYLISYLNRDILANFMWNIHTFLIRDLSCGINTVLSGYSHTPRDNHNTRNLNWNILTCLFVNSLALRFSIFDLKALLKSKHPF